MFFSDLGDLLVYIFYMLVISGFLSGVFDIYVWIFGQRPEQFRAISISMLGIEIRLFICVTILACASGVIFVAIAILLKRKPTVFLSYHHSNLDRVRRLAERMSRNGMIPLFVEFTSDPQHDALLDSIYPRIAQADFFVCLPGSKPSFVDAEVASAISAHKSIFIILPQHNNGSPDTSQKSYPALVLEKLDDDEYRSFLSFIEYLYGDWRQTIKLICGPTSHEIHPIWGFIFNIVVIPAFILIIGVLLSQIYSELGYEALRFKEFIEPKLHFPIPIKGLYAFAFLIPTLVGTLLVAIWGQAAHATWVRWKARRIVRRKIESGTYSFQTLHDLFDDTSRQFLTSFFESPPKAHHEISCEPTRQASWQST
jgi:hypothetical protein